MLGGLQLDRFADDVEAWEAEGIRLLADLELAMSIIDARDEQRRIDGLRDAAERERLVARSRTIGRFLGLASEEVKEAVVESVEVNAEVPEPPPKPMSESLRERLKSIVVTADGREIVVEELLRELLPKALGNKQRTLILVTCLPWVLANEAAAVIKMVCPDQNIVNNTIGAMLSYLNGLGLVVTKNDATAYRVRRLLNAATDKGVEECGAVSLKWYRGVRG